ncbi:MAG: hypothetical protein IK104_06960 [Clostridia bacterium]|nr:hypothetical protein [Clostridia bacterium]MBR5410395.1 hypothetical protein [Clostridia bacterium]
MLGKLIKHAFKAHARAVWGAYVAIGVVGAVMVILMLINWQNFGETGMGAGLVVKGIAALVLCLTAFVGLILTFVSVTREFRRSMVGKEGELTMALPVRASSLLFSKWLSGSFWVCLSYTALCLCFFGSFLYILRHTLGAVQEDVNLTTLLTQFSSLLVSTFGLKVTDIGVILNIITMWAVYGGVTLITIVMIFFFAIILGHCRPFHRAGVLGRILYFFGAVLLAGGFAALVNSLMPIYFVVTPEYFTLTMSTQEAAMAVAYKGYGVFSATGAYCWGFFGVIVFLVTAVLIDRKVNVD